MLHTTQTAYGVGFCRVYFSLKCSDLFGRGKFGTCTPLTLATLGSKVHTLNWAVSMLERKCIEIRKRHYLQCTIFVRLACSWNDKNGCGNFNVAANLSPIPSPNHPYCSARNVCVIQTNAFMQAPVYHIHLYRTVRLLF